MTDGPRIGLGDAYPHLRGGAQLQAQWVARAWQEQGLDVRFVVPGLGPSAFAAAAAGIPTTVVPVRGALARHGRQAGPAAVVGLPAYWRRARHAFADRDSAHLHDHRGMLLWARAARRSSVTVVWHVHALAAGPALDRACAMMADAIVVPTEAVAARYRDLGDVTVVAGAVPAPSATWAPTGAPRIVTVGRLFPSKGIDVLLEAFARLHERRPDLRLDVIGEADPTDPRTARDLQARVRALGLDDAVVFHGHLADPWPVATRASVYVQASRGGETQGLALRQARMAGMPTVATALPAWADLPEGSPVRVPVDDTVAMAAALRHVMAAPPPPPTVTDHGDAVRTAAALRAVHDRVLGR